MCINTQKEQKIKQPNDNSEAQIGGSSATLSLSLAVIIAISNGDRRISLH